MPEALALSLAHCEDAGSAYPKEMLAILPKLGQFCFYNRGRV